MAVGLTDDLSLDGDRCIRVIPRQKENQVGLVLHVMDHGLTSKIKYCQNVAQEYGVELVKKFCVQHPASKFFTQVSIIKTFC